MKFRESKLAHQYLDGLESVIEIGASAHNPFNIKCKEYKNIDFSADEIFHRVQKETCGEIAPIHVISLADDLPLRDESVDAVLSSHVLEHCFDPIKTLKEWLRVTKKDGFLFMIIPHKERTFDAEKPLTEVAELVSRHNGMVSFKTYGVEKDDHRHWNIWDTQTFLKLMIEMNLKVVQYQDSDDKVGNGFTFVIQK